MLLQLCVLGFGFFQDGDVRVGVFPYSEEILIRSFRPCRITSHRVSAPNLQMSQSTQWEVLNNTPMIEQFLELGCGGSRIMSGEICLAANIRWIQIARWVGSA